MGYSFHVGLVTDSSAFAGTERHILDLALGLRELGSEVSICCPEGSPLACRGHKEGVPMIAMGGGDASDWAAAMTLRRLLAAGTLDLLHAHNGRSALRACLAKTFARRGRVVVTQHFLSPAHALRTGWRGGVARLGHRWVHSNADRVIAISNAVRAAALARGGISSAKLTTVYNGIRDPLSRQLRPPEEVRGALGIGGRPLVVCAARLEPEKDLATLLRAWHGMAEPRPFCVIAGEGSQRLVLEEEIRCRRLGEHVRLAGFQEDALSLINAADLFVLPSPAEPFGLALLEAMALGKPVVAVGVGGPREMVVDGSNGLLVPSGDERALANAVRALMGEPERRAAFGAQGRARFLERFTLGRMAEEVGAIYAKVCRA